jgi:hypothetical protein
MTEDELVVAIDNLIRESGLDPDLVVTMLEGMVDRYAEEALNATD